MLSSKSPALLKIGQMWNRLCDVGLIGAAVNIALTPLIKVPARSEFKQAGENRGENGDEG